MAYTTINKSSEHFNTKLYTGNGGTQSITGVGHQPDFTWIKQRDNGAYSHMAFDAVRGVGKSIIPDTTAAEGNQTNGITAFGTDGFSIGDFSAGNYSGRNYVAWNWKANGAGSANTDGSINTISTSANTTAGFSVVKYLGTGSAGTIGHGLGVAPKIYIIKNLSDTTNWKFYTTAIDGSLDILNLNTTDTKSDSGGSLPTNSVFSIGTNANQGANGNGYVAYCFAEKQGYSKFGKFTGNGSTDGTFIYTGFKPAFWLQKRVDGVGGWVMYDNKRAGYNPKTDILYANDSAVEDASNSEWADIVSNGFKYRTVGGNDINTSGATYIYMAFAEAPLVGTNGVTAKAR